MYKEAKITLLELGGRALEVVQRAQCMICIQEALVSCLTLLNTELEVVSEHHGWKSQEKKLEPELQGTLRATCSHKVTE